MTTSSSRDQTPIAIGSPQTLLVEILPDGASIRSIRLPGLSHSVAVGAKDLSLYGPANRNFFGATIGRQANRIANGRFRLDGEDVALDRNEAPNHLHGGATGAWSKTWSVEERGAETVLLSLASPDGEGGYPGQARMRARFAVVGPDTLRIDYEASVDRASILGMTSHLYFNLAGTGSARDHHLSVEADAYLPVDEALIPTGEIRPVAGTQFDFRAGRRLADGPDSLDHNFCLDRARAPAPRPMARLWSEAAGVAMTLSSTECGLQVYDGQKFDGAIAGLDGAPIVRHGAIALEPQGWPDAPNRPTFPSARVSPGETYRHTSLYRFERLG